MLKVDRSAGVELPGFSVEIDLVGAEQKIDGLDARGVAQVPPRTVLSLLNSFNIILSLLWTVLPGYLQVLIKIRAGLNGLDGWR
jgi:hypothetical protein